MSATKNHATGIKATRSRTRTSRKDEPAMSVILRGVPPGYNWGWFSREDQRMHLQTVDREHAGRYKVWLERAGRRVFEPEGKISAKILKKLETEVQGLRRHIEARWVDFMIDNGWIRLAVAGTKATVTCYPGTPNRFNRTTDFRHDFRPETLAQIGPNDIVLSRELPAIEVFPNRPEERRHHFFLPTILWLD